jgi:hypothetical protein
VVVVTDSVIAPPQIAGNLDAPLVSRISTILAKSASERVSLSIL